MIGGFLFQRSSFQGTDNGICEWYFELVVDCLQDKSTTFNGILQVTVGHTSYNDFGNGVQSGWDVMLFGDEHRVRLGAKNVFKSYSTGLYQTYNIPLNASGGWVFVDTGLSAKDADLIRALSAVSLIRVRGGQYSGPETAVLKSLRWFESTDPSGTSSPASPLSADASGSSGSGGCKAKCRDGRRHYITTKYQVLSSPTGTVSTFQFTNVPLMCTSGLLEVSASGALYAYDSFLHVVSEEGEVLGNIFQKTYETAKSTLTDSLFPVISKVKMVRYSADRVAAFFFFFIV